MDCLEHKRGVVILMVFQFGVHVDKFWAPFAKQVCKPNWCTGRGARDPSFQKPHRPTYTSMTATIRVSLQICRGTCPAPEHSTLNSSVSAAPSLHVPTYTPSYASLAHDQSHFPNTGSRCPRAASIDHLTQGLPQFQNNYIGLHGQLKPLSRQEIPMTRAYVCLPRPSVDNP